MSAEDSERLIGQGQRGEQGERGKQGSRGEAGLSRTVRRALVFLFILNVLMAGANMLWTAHVVQAGNRDRCATLLAIEMIPPPPPGAGREWAAAFEAIARQRAAQLGCK